MGDLKLDKLPKNLDPALAEDYKAKMMEYMEHISYSKGKPGKALNPVVEDMDSSVHTDTGNEDEDQDDNEMASTTDSAAIEEAQRALMSRSQSGNKDDFNKELEELLQCPPVPFQARMIAKYGEAPFTQGYALIKSNRFVMFEDDGEKKLDKMLADAIPDDKTR